MHARSLPEELFSLPTLLSLDISGNNITHISNAIRNLITLKCLNIADNRIESFPYAIGFIPCLRVIHCQRNPFQDIEMSMLSGSSEDALHFIHAYVSSHKEEVVVDDEVDPSSEQCASSFRLTRSYTPYYDSFVKGSTSTHYRSKKQPRSKPDPNRSTKFHIFPTPLLLPSPQFPPTRTTSLDTPSPTNPPNPRFPKIPAKARSVTATPTKWK